MFACPDVADFTKRDGVFLDHHVVEVSGQMSSIMVMLSLNVFTRNLCGCVGARHCSREQEEGGPT